jgi:uncharacterized membrane protein
MTRLLLIAVTLTLLVPGFAYAQDQTHEVQYLEKAKVVTASASQTQTVEGTDVTTQVQDLTVQVLEGPDKGQIVSFTNDFTQVQTGDVVYVRHIVGGFDPEMWSLSDPYRLNVLIGLFAVFLVLVFFFGGLPGIRGLASLAGSLILIFALLLPGLYAGYSPILLSIAVASLIIVVGSYITHGFNRTTSAAVISMIATVLVTGAAAYYVVQLSHLSGFTSEENVYLNFNTGGAIDMVGLLFGGIMIGLLGVLYDIAIGQAIAVEELIHAGKHMTRRQIYLRALRIGREHIGALINTLAIAYVGSALPLLLLFHNATTSIPYILNSETFATEIIRILIGSIGLILAVPTTTLIASYFIRVKDPVTSHAH